jgi:pheromone shutdown-related protein TraB
VSRAKLLLCTELTESLSKFVRKLDEANDRQELNKQKKMSPKPDQIRIIGTSHVAKQSIEEIKETVEEFQPEIVAVELDLQRALALLQEQKSKVPLLELRNIGLQGYLFAKLGQYFQQKIGQNIGVSPGSEMKTALKLAQEKSLTVAFIDQPIKKTLRNFSKEFSWKEKFRFLADIFKGIFFRKQQIKELGIENWDLSKVPEEQLVEKLIEQMRKKYPGLYKALVDDRNKYMASQLIKIYLQNPEKKILAIMGAGHKKEVERILWERAHSL